MSDLFALAERLKLAGEPFVIATVVRTERPTSAQPGDKAIIGERGLIEGWIGGSCAEPTVLNEARAALLDGECRLLHISPDAGPQVGREGLKFVPMSCYSGGTLEIYLEPHLAAPQLAVYGHSPVARALVALARLMKFRVTVIDLRADAADDDGVVRDLSRLNDFRPGYAVVATHGVFDEQALEHALASGAAFIGLVASQRRAQSVRAALAARGVPAVDRLRSPVGLDLGGHSPEEIALSIVAEIVQTRNAATASAADSPTRPASHGVDAGPQPKLEAAAAASCCSISAHSPTAREVSDCCHRPGAALPVAVDGVEAILLAAGESRRMGGTNKLLIAIDGRPLVRRSVETLLESGLARPIVVLGFEAERVRAALAGLPVQFVENPSYREGQQTSVRAGLAALPHALAGVMICLADQPALSPDDLREIRRAFLERRRGSALVPTHRGQRGNPIVLDRPGLDQILARGGNFGCRQFTTHHADLVETYEMSSDSVLRDLDCPEDVAALGARATSEAG